MTSGTHTIIATSTMIGDPPLRLLRSEPRSTTMLADFDDEPTQHARQRVITRQPLLTRTAVGGGRVSFVITLGDGSLRNLDVDSPVARPGVAIPLPRG
jgi:hypothetical protein